MRDSNPKPKPVSLRGIERAGKAPGKADGLVSRLGAKPGRSSGQRLAMPVDLKRDKHGVTAAVVRLVYDPNRAVTLARVRYSDGEERYILAPEGLREGDTIASGPGVAVRAGNALPLAGIPLGTTVHNVELRPGKGAQMARSAGAGVIVAAKNESRVTLLMPSGDTREVSAACMATIGRVAAQNQASRPSLATPSRKGGAARPTIRTTFVRRVANWAKEVARSAPEEVLAAALASATVRGGLVRLLTEVGADVEVSPASRLREEALARGLAAKEALREASGGFKPTAWVAEHLQVTRQAVDKRRRGGKLLALETADGSFEYPLCQFTADGVVPGLGDALASFGVENPWERLAALVNPAPALSGASVIEVLRDARAPEDRARALAVVRDFLR